MAINTDHRENSFQPTDGILRIKSSGSLVIPVGSDTDRPSVPSAGMIRFNDTNGSVEFYDGTAWKSLNTGIPSKISDTDGDTVVTVENSADEDIVRIFASGSEIMTVVDDGVGINTVSPSYALDVSGDASVSDTLYIGQSTNSAKLVIDTTNSPDSYIIFTSSQTKWKMGENVSGAFEISDISGNSYIRIDPSLSSNTFIKLNTSADSITMNAGITEILSDVRVSSNGVSYYLPSSAGSPGQVLATGGNGGRMYWKTVAGVTEVIKKPPALISGNWSIYSPIILHSEGFNDVQRMFYVESSSFVVTPWAGSLYTGWASNNHVRSGYTYRETGFPAEVSGTLKYMVHAMSTYAVVTDTGELAARSRNFHGILGTGDTSARQHMIKIPQSSFGNRRVLKVDIGGGDTLNQNRECMLVLVSGGLMYGAGFNGRGSLGIGTFSASVTTFSPAVFLSTLSTITTIEDFSISPNDTPHTLIVVSAGTGYEIYATGRNDQGQLGVGDTTDREGFVLVSGIPSSDLAEKPRRILCAGRALQANSFVLTYNGKLYHAGSNAYGSSGDGTTTQHNYFVNVTPSSGSQVFSAIMVWAPYFYNASTFVLVDNNGNAELYAAGFNGDGQLGVGDKTNRSTWTKVNVPFDLNTERPKKLIGASYNSNAVFILTEKGRIFASGYKALCVVGANGDATTFTEARLPRTDGQFTDITGYLAYDYATVSAPANNDYIVRSVTTEGEMVDMGIYHETDSTFNIVTPYLRKRDM